MKLLFSRIINLLLTPFKHYPLSFVFLVFALFIPEILTHESNLLFEMSGFFGYRLLLCASLIYLVISLVFFFSKLSKTASRLLIILFHIVILGLVFIDIFLVQFFGIHINTYMLQLIDETNSQESSEFLHYYLHTRFVFKLCAAFVVLVAIEIILAYLLRRFKFPLFFNSYSKLVHKCKIFFTTLFSLFIFISLGFLIYIIPCFSLNWKQNVLHDRAWDTGISLSFVFKCYQSVIQFVNERSSFERCAKAQENITAVLETPHAPNIIIIIGESFNRHHSSLYGYGLPTNYNLQQIKHLYIFDDVITPVNLTSASFQQFLSLSNNKDRLEWYDVPLFPSIFKSAGYNVSFFSNQFVKELDMSPFDASAGFINHPLIEPHLFTHRNSNKHSYDEGLIEEYKNKRCIVEKDSLNLIFFHLQGQHVDPFYRYPRGRDKFHISDYYRPELTEKQLQHVANYDNATAYNDSVVCNIIKLYNDKDAVIIYFADHGDEANDYRPHIGRTLNLNEVGAPGLHCQLDIPFLIYLTDSCIARHPELEQRISKSIHLPFMLDDLPHLLLDIANIQTPWFRPSRSLINENYDTNTHRIIDNGYSTTTPIDYDSVCYAYGEWRIGFKNPNYEK